MVMAIYSAGAQTIEKYYDYNGKQCEPSAARFFSTVTKTDSGYNRSDYFIRGKTLQMTGKYSDADCNIPNGYFRSFYFNGIEEAEGAYLEGEKEGLWMHYHPNQMMKDSGFYRGGQQLGTSLSWHRNGFISDSTTLKDNGSGVQVRWFDNGGISSAGQYSAGRKQHGKWNYFHNTGVVSAIESFQHGRSIDRTYFDEDGRSVADTTSKDREATFPGGVSAWLKYLSKKTSFPLQYKYIYDDKAIVIVSFAVSEDGSVVEAYVSTPLLPEFDKIAEDAVMQSPKWIPAISHNRKIKSWFRQPVTFPE